MLWVRLSGLVMVLGIALGAFGAHALRDQLSPEGRQWFQTAVFYHLLHGVALLGLGWLAVLKPGEPLVRQAGWAFLLGIILFSGSLYVMSLTEIKRLGIITPFGGAAFLVGWACVLLAAR